MGGIGSYSFGPTLSTISAHGRALKPWEGSDRTRLARLSTISAHGRALKHGVLRGYSGVTSGDLSTISAHGRALKPGAQYVGWRVTTAFQQFRLTVEH